MSAPLLSRAPPTCLSCLRRTFAGGAVLGGGEVAAPAASALGLTQTRGKKQKGAQRDQGVLVRLLKDIKQFGPKHSIFLAPRGKMRNIWYPSKKAEYMTTARFAELGLTRDAIGQRDPLFGLADDSLQIKDMANGAGLGAGKLPNTEKATVQTTTPEPEHAAVLLQNILPDVITFSRKAMPSKETAVSPENKSPRPSPLVAANATISGTTNEEPAAAAIFGSVSTADLAVRVREMLLGHAEAELIPMKQEHFVIEGVVGEDGKAAPANKVRSLGRWAVTISVPGGDEAQVKPLTKYLEVVAS